MGPILVVLIRLLVPLSVFKFKVWGPILAVAADFFDVILITIFASGDFSNYHMVDKWLDMYFLTIFLITTRKWKLQMLKTTALVLYLWRLVGFVLFEITGIRWLLLVFPNLFNSFYLFYVIWRGVAKKEPIRTKKQLFLFLGVLLIPKLIQEFGLHYLQLQPWNFVKENVFGIKPD